MNPMDKASWFGLLLGFGAILIGNFVEGGHIGSLMQLTAFVIVLGGTVGATMVSNRAKDLRKGFAMFKSAFREQDDGAFRRSMAEIVDCARLARKESALALEPRLAQLSDPFVAKMLKNVVDGVDPVLVRALGETEISADEEDEMSAVKIWIDAGGFSPTIGIIGAVLGLIHVMGNLTDTSKLGSGIAVAFVATVYGVSFANLLFLPIGNKLKKRVQKRVREREILLEAVLMIGANMNPLLVEQRLQTGLEAPSA